MRRRLLERQEGVALVLVVAFMALAVPLVTAGLGLAGTLAVDSRVKTGIMKSQYAALSGSNHALYRILYEEGYADGLEAGVEDNYTITVNGREVTITILKVEDPPTEPPPPPADNSRRLQTLKEVTPTTADPNVPTTFTYTITVENRDDQAESLRKVYDELPTGFSYVAGSTSITYPGGSGSPEPSIAGQQLTWTVTGLNISLAPGQAATLTFRAEASVGQGNYCNEAWVDPGGRKTSSGKTAVVQVGAPPDSLCQGAAVQVTTSVEPQAAPGNTPVTFTYTITIENAGTDTLNMSRLRDYLPDGFTYVAGSTGGDVTSADPTATMFQGRQRLDWDFSPKVQVASGTTRTLTFQAEATAEPGDYWNEVWVTFDEFAEPVYTWPTAVVNIMGVFETTATDGESTATSEVWVGTDSFIITQWGME